MSLETLVSLAATLWQIPPVRWFVWLGVALYVAFVVAMEVKRQLHKNGLERWEKWVNGGSHLIVLAFDIPFHLLASVPLWDRPRIFDSSVAFLEREWTLTQRFQRYLDHPDEAGWRYHVAKWWKPKLNRHDPGHLK